MGRRALDDEIGRRLRRAADLGADAGITGLQGAVAQARPVAPNRGVESRAARPVDLVVDCGNPFDIGAEAGLAGKIEGDVDAEPARRRHRIDEPAERCAAAQGEIHAAAEIGGRDRVAGDAFDGAGQFRGIKPGGVDQVTAANGAGLVAAGFELEAVGANPPAEDRGAQRDRRTGSLGLALVGEHQRVAVDDPGRRRQEGRDAVQFRLEAPRLRRVEAFEIIDAIDARRVRNPVERRKLRLAGGDDDLAELRVREPMLAAIGVEATAALDAGRRLQAVLGIVDAAVDDLAVARRGLETDGPGALDDHHFTACQRQCPRRGETDHPGADDHAFDFVHATLRRHLQAAVARLFATRGEASRLLARMPRAKAPS